MLSINNIIGSVKSSLTLPIIFIEFIRFIKLKVHKVCRLLWDNILLTAALATESKIVNRKSKIIRFSTRYYTRRKRQS